MAILSENANSLPEARQTYSNLNDKYLIDHTIENTDLPKYNLKISDYPEISDYIFKSRIAYTTPDLSRMIRCYSLPDDNIEQYYLNVVHHYLMCYDYIENGELTVSTIEEGDTGPYFYDTIKYKKYPDEYVKRIEFFKDSFVYYDTHSETFQIYSSDTMKMVYDITLPEGYSIKDYSLSGMIIRKDFLPVSTYYYDFDTQELSFLEDYVFNSKISPDGKLVAYTSADHDSVKECFVLPSGFYIANLETSTTVFYPFPEEYGTYSFLTINCWIDKDCLNKIINGSELS